MSRLELTSIFQEKIYFFQSASCWMEYVIIKTNRLHNWQWAEIADDRMTLKQRTNIGYSRPMNLPICYWTNTPEHFVTFVKSLGTVTKVFKYQYATADIFKNTFTQKIFCEFCFSTNDTCIVFCSLSSYSDDLCTICKISSSVILDALQFSIII